MEQWRWLLNQQVTWQVQGCQELGRAAGPRQPQSLGYQAGDVTTKIVQVSPQGLGAPCMQELRALSLRDLACGASVLLGEKGQHSASPEAFPTFYHSDEAEGQEAVCLLCR